MEILSQMVKGTGSGVNFSQQRAGPQIQQENSKFARAVEDALVRKGLLPVKELRQQSTILGHKPHDTLSEPDEDMDENLVAGVIGNQNLFVSILEGDKESATDPEMLIDTAESVGTDRMQDVPHMTDVPTTAEADIAVEDNTTANEFNIAMNEANKTETAAQEAKSENEFAETTGEVTARMPEVRTSDKSENVEKNSKSTDDGNLGPLENGNETAGVKEKHKTSKHDMAQTDRRSEEDTEKLQNNAPVPLAEGIRPERFRADQQMRQTTLDAPVKAENLFEEMILRIDSMKSDTTQSMTIQLKPEFLGKVALELMVDAAGLHVKINAANSDVRAMINGQINALIESLEQKGIEVVGVEVLHTGIDNGVNQHSQGGRAQTSNPKHRYRSANPSDRVEYYSVMPFNAMEYYLDAGVSSVEYSA